jgi:hypothetical protein
MPEGMTDEFRVVVESQFVHQIGAVVGLAARSRQPRLPARPRLLSWGR